MARKFIIEDDFHAETVHESSSRELALGEARRLFNVPWDTAPNRCPCQSWKSCHRTYDLIEYETSATPWAQISRERLFEVSAAGAQWHTEEQ